jgi:hypothetical protein
LSYLISNIPHFKCWVRKEFTHNHIKYHGEHLHGLAIAVNTIPDRCLSFQVVFTGIQEEENTVGGAMWARLPIGGEFYKGRYMFTVDYTDSYISDDPAQHKQSHVLQLTDAGKWTGNIVALPNNRVRVTNPALWIAGEGAPDFAPSQYIHSAEIHDSYTDPNVTFNNLYKEKTNDEKS